MLDLDELDRRLQGRLWPTVMAYYKASGAFLDAMRQLTNDPDADASMHWMAAMNAKAMMNASEWLIGAQVAMVEGVVTIEEARARLDLMDDPANAVQWELTMRWLAHKRRPDAPTLEEVLIAAGRRYGMGDPAALPADDMARHPRGI